MKYYRQLIIVGCVAVFAFSSCTHMPDHARYIPKDAIVVAGINIKALTKKVAWNVITGSKLWQDMQKKVQGEKGNQKFEDAGIDLMNTMYVYVKTDVRFHNGRATAIIPLSDAGKWETFVNSNFPTTAITEQGKIKTANLTTGMYAGWRNNVLILLNAIPSYGDDDTGDSSLTAKKGIDEVQLQAEMESAFNVTNENALINNKHYVELEKQGHDIFLWMNYDQLMNQYLGQGAAGLLNGLSMANTFWKDAALTAGFDFEKGRIAGEMHYYTSDEMKDLGKELGSVNADKEMINKLPAKNLDVLAAYHLSPKGARAIMEKMGVLGFMNLALTEQNLDVDQMLDAFTGDMAMSINGLAIKPNKEDTFFHEPKPKLSYLYVLKINRQENFNKLLGIAKKNGLTAAGNNLYFFSFITDTVYLATDNKYAVVTNSAANATAYIQNAGTQITEATEVYEHPVGLYINLQQVMSSVDTGLLKTSKKASATLADSKKMFENAYLSGGSYNDNGFEYRVAINFMNKDENSLLQLMDFAMRVNEDRKE